MIQVNIYIHVDSRSQKETDKWFGYVVEMIRRNGEPVTVDGFDHVTATWHGATIEAITAALRRLNKPCEVTVTGDNAYVLNSAQNNLQQWAEDGFTRKKGKPLANREKWEALWIMWKTHGTLVSTRKSEYDTWLARETERKKLTCSIDSVSSIPTRN